MHPDDYPRSMRDRGVRLRRKGMLEQEHIAPLTRYAASLRATGRGEVPEFDPLDGGTKARALFLFEKPGRKTSEANGGSGFISRNNDDRTAEATFDFMKKAGIRRELTVTWNAVPWWNSTRAVTGQELSAGAACVRDLIALLPELRVVVFVGQKAANHARTHVDSSRFKLITSDHPSPLVRASWRARWEAIPQSWAETRQFL